MSECKGDGQVKKDEGRKKSKRHQAVECGDPKMENVEPGLNAFYTTSLMVSSSG